MSHGLSGLSTYGLNGHRKGDEHPTYARKGTARFTSFTGVAIGGTGGTCHPYWVIKKCQNASKHIIFTLKTITVLERAQTLPQTSSPVES